MKKITKRAGLCLILACLLLAGLVLFVVRFVLFGSTWAAQPFNRDLYNDNGELARGTVADRDGTVLTGVDENGERYYCDDAEMRKALLHVLGDAQGNIGTGVLTAFGSKLAGYNLITGAGSTEEGNTLQVTIDADYNLTAYEAMDGRKGVVAVYNYKTGEILCEVSTPTYDVLNVPDDLLTNEDYEGVFVNRFYSSTYTPGSIFKTVTIAAALENITGVTERTFTCEGSLELDGGEVTCEEVHGTEDLEAALANSCNIAFGGLAVELGGDLLQQYTEKAGLMDSYSINGISTEPGSFDFSNLSDYDLAWAGDGQYNDLVNPCSMMVYMGAIANGGEAAVPQIILSNETSYGLSIYSYQTEMTDTLIEADTAETLRTYMANNVEVSYGGSERFPNMEICAKTGTAELSEGEDPHSWFVGFLENEDYPLAFVVLIENGGYGSDAAASVAATVLNEIVNGN